MTVYSAFPQELLLQDYCLKILFFVHLSTMLLLKKFTWPGLRVLLPVQCPFLSLPLFLESGRAGGREGSQRRWFQHFQPNGRKQEHFGKLIRSIGELGFIPPFVKPGDFFFKAFNVERSAYPEFDQRWHSYSNCWIKRVNDLPRLTQQFTKKTDLHKTEREKGRLICERQEF